LGAEETTRKAQTPTSGQVLTNLDPRLEPILGVLLNEFRGQISELKQRNEELTGKVNSLETRPITIPTLPGPTEAVIIVFLVCWVLKAGCDAYVRKRESDNRVLEELAKSSAALLKSVEAKVDSANSAEAKHFQERLGALAAHLRQLGADLLDVLNKKASEIAKNYPEK